MNAFDNLWIWDDAALARRLDWYRAVAVNRRPAKFRVAAAVPVAIDLEAASEDSLWSALDGAMPAFITAYETLRGGGGRAPAAVHGSSLLDLLTALAGRMLGHCNFCRWDCGVDRTLEGGKLGTCKLETCSRVSSYFHHQGEELIYRGDRGSGTIFFTSCNMRCVFCQNGDISTDKDNGRPIDARTLATMAWLLRHEGCHNINWVGGDPTIHLHTIVDAIRDLGHGFTPDRDDLSMALPSKADGVATTPMSPAFAEIDGAFNAPMLWNSNFYMSAEAMRLLRPLIDVWLPDFKFGPGRCAIDLARTPHYWETVTSNLKLLENWGDDLTIRHLVMPDHVECCTYPILEWIAETMPSAPINIMDQYRPDMAAHPEHPDYRDRFEDISRRPEAWEIRAAYEYADDLGLAWKTVTTEKTAMKLGA